MPVSRFPVRISFMSFDSLQKSGTIHFFLQSQAMPVGIADGAEGSTGPLAGRSTPFALQCNVISAALQASIRRGAGASSILRENTGNHDTFSTHPVHGPAIAGALTA